MTQGAYLRALDPDEDRNLVRAALAEVEDYYRLWLGRAAEEIDVDEFFSYVPPDCEIARSDRLGLFVGDRISGLIEMAYGYPARGDAYLGMMLLSPRVRGQGFGARAFRGVEDLARKKGAQQMYLGVLDANPRGRAFWERQGFRDTGFARVAEENGITHRIARLHKPL